MDLTQIRRCFVHGNMEQAFSDLNHIAPKDLQNDIQLLWAQFNNWQRENLILNGIKPEERNRILYASLALVSQIEEKDLSGLTALRSRALLSLELDLTHGYTHLCKIRKKTIIDIFLIWMVERHEFMLNTIITQEKTYGRSPDLAILLQKADLVTFISINNLKSKPQDVIQYFLKKNAETKGFFSNWFEYRSRQDKFEEALEIQIEKCEKRHGSLLKAGLIGGILGAIGLDIFHRNMDLVLAHYVKGLDLPIFNDTGSHHHDSYDHHDISHDDHH